MMAVPAVISVSIDYGKVPDAIRKSPDEVYRLIEYDVLTEASVYVANRLSLNTPSGASGKAAQSVVHDVSPGLLGFEGHVDYSEPSGSYIVFADQGTRPHWPPYQPIALWAQRVLGTTSPAIVGAIRFGISRSGTKAQKFVERTANEVGPDLGRVAAIAADKAVRRLAP